MGTITDLRKHGGADAYVRNGPARTIVESLSSKWAVLVLGALRAGPLRFNELRRRLDGVTQKMLARTLRTIERDGLVTRTMYPTIPPRVEYELTDLGRDVGGLMDAVVVWAERHVGDVLTARHTYDQRAGEEPGPVR